MSRKAGVLLLAMAALSGASCDAVLGIQRYGEPGGNEDAMAPDGPSGPEGGRDARPDSKDSSKEVDQTTADAGDAAMEASSCIAVATPSLPAHGGAACTSSDGTTCFPTDVTTFTPEWVPPPPGTPHAKACTTALVTASYMACYGTGSTSTSCSDWISLNATCAACIFSDLGASQYGAVIVEGAGSANGYTYPNLGGCIALAEPCNKGCAEAVLADDLCGFAACSIMSGGPCATASEAAASACLASSDSTADCSCGGYIDYQDCLGALIGDETHHPSVSLCALDQTDFEVSYEAIADFMCGP
jgi:hypothetical protein